MYVQCGYAAVQDNSISSEIAYKIQSARKGTKKNVYMQKKMQIVPHFLSNLQKEFDINSEGKNLAYLFQWYHHKITLLHTWMWKSERRRVVSYNF